MVAVVATILAFGALTNILLALCLAHTWKYWRQVKIYIILLLVGNVLDVAVAQAITLHSHINGSYAVSRSFVVFLQALGSNLYAYAVAALGVHVLITSITGNQGNRLRHALVLTLFVVLALVMPFMSLALPYNLIGDAAALFPIGVALLCTLAATVVFCTRRGNMKGDEDKSDLILAFLMGATLLIFCAPLYIYVLLVITTNYYYKHTFFVHMSLYYLMCCFPIVSALINIVFAYVNAYRSRARDETPGSSSNASGERQKLVN